jgi:hypothetical protein
MSHFSIVSQLYQISADPLITSQNFGNVSICMGKDLDPGALEQLIVELLGSIPTCVIATCHRDIPRASTVEFFPLGTTLYILTEGGTKVRNVLRNPHVSIAVHVPFTGWENVRGVQITGIAELGRKGSPIFKEGLEAYRKRKELEMAELPDFMHVIKVIPRSIEYIDVSLGERGFNMRQRLRSNKGLPPP